MKDHIKKDSITCHSCKTRFKRKPEEGDKKKRKMAFCAFCGTPLEQSKTKGELTSHTSFVKEQIPSESQILASIGPYQILKNIGKGGMGEVFLAYDTICGRKIALKRIRKDLFKHPQLQNRFIREAKITSQLTHPTIIPIYSIH